MATYVEESGMKFGPFEDDFLFRIEKSPQYFALRQSMHISEFIYYRKKQMQIIALEAKSTAPNPRSARVENPTIRFREFISEIREKFENSLDLYVNLALKNDLPDGFKRIDYAEVKIVFILVIKNHESAWLHDVKDALEMAISSIHRTNKIWKCKVLVLNEEIARCHHWLT